MDKEGTMAMAREIGTYDVSKEPFDDCCSFLAPRRPETWASPASVREAESALNIAELVRGTVGQAEVESFVSPSTEIPEPAGP
jgi:thiamine biosynthesis protein ThiI